MLLWVVFALVSPSLAQPPNQGLICATSLWPDNFLVAEFATRHFAPMFPLTNWSFQLITAAADRRDLLFAFLANGANCDVLIGPGFSSYAVAFSPLVPSNMIWLNPSATSTELSNKDAHPSFSRTIPTDDVNAGALAVVARHFGWSLASVLCLDDAYGRSVAQGFSTSFATLGGTIELSRCYSSDSTNSTVKRLLSDVFAADSRVLFVAAFNSPTLVHQLELSRAHERLILLFPEGDCTDAMLTKFPGSICANYEPDPSYATFEATYRTRTDRRLVQTAAAAGNPFLDRENVTRPYGAFAADAVRLGMESLASYHTSGNRTGVSLAAWTRQRTFDGFSGRVLLHNVTGDRASARLAVFNGRPAADGGWQITGHVADMRYTAAPVTTGGAANGASAPTSASGPYWLGSFYSHTPPSGMRPVDQESGAFPWWYIAGGAVVALLVACFVVYRARRARALAKWPCDEAQPFAVMFVGTKNEDAAAELYPANIAAAQTAVAKAVRQCVAANNCVEARRVGDGTVMVASKSPSAILACAISVVDALDALDWRTLLPEEGRSSRAGGSGVDRDDAVSHRSGHSRISHRSRVSTVVLTSAAVGSAFGHVARLYPNIGIHFGKGHIDHDEERNVFSYHGDVVAIAAEVADNAVEQHVLVTDAVVSFLDSETDVAIEAMQAFVTLSVAGKRKSNNNDGSHKVPTFSYLPEASPRTRALERLLQHTVENRAKCKDAAGNVAGALMAAETGVSQRRIGCVHLHVPSLLNEGGATSRDEHQNTILQTLDAIGEVVRAHRGHIEYVHDASVVISVNARGKAVTAAPACRAAAIAVDVDETLSAMGMPNVTAGVATSTAMIGTCSEAHVAIGCAATYAAQLCKAARRLDVRVLALGESYSDLFTAFSVTTIDIACFASPAGFVRRARIVSVNNARDKQLEGEWLYNVTTAATVYEELFKKVQHNQLTDGDREERPALPAVSPEHSSREERATHMAAERVAAAIAHDDVEAYARTRAVELGIGASF